MPAPVYLDLSELVSNPLRSGIQRIEREAIRHWPGPAPLLPCIIDGEGALRLLPTAVLDVLCAEDSGTNAARAAEQQALSNLIAVAEPLPAGTVRRLLNLELFFAPVRAAAHVRLAAEGVRVLWYLYDFLPFLRPDLFPQGTTRHCMHFLRGLRAATSIAFLSEQTRQDYTRRVSRMSSPDSAGPVLLPGADGLQLERQSFSRDRHDFVAIGTVEARKNIDALLAAFELLWNAGTTARLIIAGRISPDAIAARSFFAHYASNPCLVVMDQPADKTLCTVLRHTRAVIMPSEAEGFGLPPYEAVHSGIPAIVCARLPSAALLPGGVKRLERMDPLSIAGAVTSLQDDETAERLWTEAAAVSLPTWTAFGHSLGAWAQAV